MFYFDNVFVAVVGSLHVFGAVPVGGVFRGVYYLVVVFRFRVVNAFELGAYFVGSALALC